MPSKVIRQDRASRLTAAAGVPIYLNFNVSHLSGSIFISFNFFGKSSF